MKNCILSAVVLFFFSLSTSAQSIDLEKFLDKADLATGQYIKTFKNLVAEEQRTYEYFRTNETLEDSRKIKSNFIVYQSSNKALVGEYRNVIEFNGKNVARSDDDIAKFFGKLAKANTSDEEAFRLRNEGNRFDGRSHSYGMTLVQTFVLNKYFRPSFEFQIAGREQIDGRDTVIVEYKQTKANLRIQANATDEERKLEPHAITFDSDVPSSFRPTNPRLQGKLWLDAETGQLRKNEFTVTLQPAILSKPVVSAILSYEYQSSEFGVLLPKKFSVVSYRFSGKGEKDLVRTKSATKTFEYSKFSKPDSEIKDVKTGN